MTRVIIWLIVGAIVVRLVWRFVHAIMEGAGMVQAPPSRSVKLVRDPNCGTYVLPSQAVTSGSGADTKYFCSEKCRKAWRSR